LWHSAAETGDHRDLGRAAGFFTIIFPDQQTESENSEMSVDSANSSYRYVPVDGFNPNSATGWTAFGNVTQCVYDAADAIFTITATAPAEARRRC